MMLIRDILKITDKGQKKDIPYKHYPKETCAIILNQLFHNAKTP